jgi:N-acetylglucosamine-6-phosphate deacetylase
MAVRVLRGNLILADRVIEGGLVVVEDGVIAAVAEDSRFATTEDLGSHFIAPGFIDLHTHGIAGADTMDATQESLSLMARRFAMHGVMGFLPTTVTQSLEATLEAIGQVRRYMEIQGERAATEAQVLGIHLEGPWISAQYKGAQNERYILAPTEESVRRILSRDDRTIKIVSLAPELPGAERAIEMLRNQAVYISVGHTGATYEHVLRAIELGATHITHCFNAMTPLHHRQPGVVGASLLRDELYVELIADAVHVHPDVMRLLVRLKGPERVMLVTDSMSATELPDGTYDLGGQEVLVEQGQARLLDGTLAGSTLTLERAVWNVVHLCGLPLHQAVYMASAAPAMAIGLGDRKGRISAGYDADFAILDANLQPIRIDIGGRPI